MGNGLKKLVYLGFIIEFPPVDPAAETSDWLDRIKKAVDWITIP